MLFIAAAIAFVLTSIPTALGVAVQSTSISSITCVSSTAGICSTTGASRTTSVLSTTVSFDMNESTAACPIATALPACAANCVHSAAMAIGCAMVPDMHRCQCQRYSRLVDQAAMCIIGACGIPEALHASSVGLQICSVCEGIFA